MKRNVSKIFVITAVSWLFLFYGISLVEAKDPDYPTKPINFIIPWAAGGPTTEVTRPFLEAASKVSGQPFVILNKPGGAALLGATVVLNAKPDGYTLGLFTAGHVTIAPHIEDTPYRDLSGFTIIAKFISYPQAFTVRGDSPYKTWQDFIKWAKNNPRAAKICFPSSKTKSPQGLVMWQIEQKEGVEITYMVPQGTAEALTLLLGGHITGDFMALNPTKLQYVREGKLKILTYATPHKNLGFENIPSLGELYPDIYPFDAVMGIWGPKDLPAYVMKRLEDAFSKAASDHSFIEMANRLCLLVSYKNSVEFGKDIYKESLKAKEIIDKLRGEEEKGKK
jgi:tripartite-type tricarboxylate transporter receptor subunit TctC